MRSYEKMINGIRFLLTTGDITTVYEDAIVNVAHEALMGGGGVDGAIHRASGERLIQACRKIPEVEPGVRCRVGEAKITQAFNQAVNLPRRYVIHTVAPKFVGSIVNGKFKNINKDGDQQLANCYGNSIQLAAEERCRSIAFPSLGTGVHAYPIEVACPIAISSCIEAASLYFFGHIRFVCFSDSDYEAYEQELIKR